MEVRSLRLNGGEFNEFALTDPNIWTKIVGVQVHHRKFGLGRVVHVEPRLNYIPLITIRFDGDVQDSLFNSYVFISDAITEVEIPELLSKSVLDWKANQADEYRRIVEREANKVRLQKIEEEKSLVRSRHSADYAEEEMSRIMSYFSFVESIGAVPSGEVADWLRYYRGALPKRMNWIKKLSRSIQKNEAWYQPAFSNGENSIELLRAQGITHLWHFTDIRNVKIINNVGGLVSWAGIKGLGLNDAKMVANELSRDCDIQTGREQFIRLSFIPNSFYFHRVKDHQNLVWLKFSLDALKLHEVYYTKGNAASINTRLCHELAQVGINWDTVREFCGVFSDGKGPTYYKTRYLNDGDDLMSFSQEKNSWNSEVLIKDFLPLSFCVGIYDAVNGQKITTP